jgi:predicted anti-sigma-YlaC factor YlaD
MTACDTVWISLGALAVSALDAAEEQRVRAHMAACPRCAAEFAELSDTVRMLATARPEALPADVEPDPKVLTGLLAAVTKDRRRSRGRRLALGFAAAAASAVVAGAGVLLVTDDEPAQPPSVAATPTAELHGSDGSVALDVDLFAKAWGTAVQAEVSGVPLGATCSLVAVGIDGSREVAATWTVPRGGYDPATGSLRFDGAVGMRPHEVIRYEVVTTEGDVLAAANA